MTYKKKKFISLLTALLMSALFVTACQNSGGGSPTTEATTTVQNTTTAQSTTAPTTSASAVNATDSSWGYTSDDFELMPITTEPITLRYWCGPPSYTNVAPTRMDQPCFQVLEAVSGVTLVFETGEFGVMVASGDYPDLIKMDWTRMPDGASKYIEQGVIMDLKPHLEEYAPNFLKAMQRDEEIRIQNTTDEGYVVMFGMQGITHFGLQVRKDWCDALGIELPQTIDEWHNMLLSFKNDDPNGNGEADEIPLANYYAGYNTLKYFTGAFKTYEGSNSNPFYNDEGTIKFGPLTDNYKQWITEMAKWYAEGLIDPDYLVNGTEQCDANMLSEKIGAIGENTKRVQGKYLDMMKNSNPDFTLVSVLTPMYTDGQHYFTGDVYHKNKTYRGTAISAKTKYLEAAMRYCDWAYSDEGILFWNYGLENISYTMENGKPVYTDEIMKNPNGWSIDEAQVYWRLIYDDLMGIETEDSVLDGYIWPQQLELVANTKKENNDLILPALYFTSDESMQIGSKWADINTFRNEQVNAFIMGQRPISEYDSFVDELKRMGIEDLVGIYQDAYDRYLVR